MDLRAKPYSLNDEDIRWVEDTLAGLTLREKVGQLFCLNIMEEDIKPMLARLDALDIRPGSFMTRDFDVRTVRRNFKALQEWSALPLLTAANIERGADGVCEEGTMYGTQMQLAATGNLAHAYQFGLACGREAAAAGVNWNFGPIIDIDYNPNNPITNTRVFSSDPEVVRSMGLAYVRGMRESGIAVCVKHWPGDGRDGRDQHMVTSINDFSVEEWDATYGRIYRDCFEEGAESLMAAHILLPSWSRKLVPGIADRDILPGSLSHELTTTLLKKKMGFNGLVVTDATTMNGFMQALPRAKAVPMSISAGCDIFLFVCDLEEDFNLMLKGIEDGILTLERLNEAVATVLAFKAMLKLPEKSRLGTLMPDESALEVFRSETHRNQARACADEAVTLVKDTQNLLPLDLNRHRRVLLHCLGDKGGYHDRTTNHVAYFRERLQSEGFEVTDFDPADASLQYTKTTVASLRARFDLILYFANIKTSGSDNVARITWKGPGALDSTRYVHDIPTLFVSVDNPYHLIDVPAVKTYINGYTPNRHVMDAVVEKLMGRSEFTGENPVDPFCGLWNARI